MKILMLLSSPRLSGPAELCLDDARALAARGHEILFGCDTRRPGAFAGAIRAAGFPLMEELTLCQRPRPGEVVRDLLGLRRRLAAADIVHCRFAHEHSLVLLAGAGLRRKAALVRTAEIAPALGPGRLRGAGFRACRAVVVSCRDYARRLHEDHRVVPSRVHVVPGRVDPERFSPGDGADLRRELGVGPGEILLGIVSRIKAERRHDLLVRAFGRAARRLPELRLAVIGRGEHEPALRGLVRDLGLENRVFFAGYRSGDGLVAAYRALDAAAWLAEGNDGTCRALLEAMACGRPVLTVNEGAMGEIVRDGIEGSVVAPTPEDVERGILALCDPGRREAMGRNALGRALEFSPGRRTSKLMEVYRSAIEAVGTQAGS